MGQQSGRIRLRGHSFTHGDSADMMRALAEIHAPTEAESKAASARIRRLHVAAKDTFGQPDPPLTMSPLDYAYLRAGFAARSADMRFADLADDWRNHLLTGDPLNETTEAWRRRTAPVSARPQNREQRRRNRRR